jgi:hypothetical protein
VIAIGAREAKPAAPDLVSGEGADGAALDGEAYIFVTSGPQRAPAAIAYRAPLTSPRHFVSGLTPGARYSIAMAASGAVCRVSLTPSGAGGVTASAAGTVALEAKGCARP